MSNNRVLVTGASGYLGVACIAAALNAGYRVRGTLRSMRRVGEVRAMVTAAGADPSDIEFVEADLLADAGWSDAAAGCQRVLHVASPFPTGSPADEMELITPAVEGTRRVLAAARGAGVGRVVLTSSFAAIGYGHGDAQVLFTEDDWSVTDGLPAYPKSKTLAERAAWDYVADGGPELTVINPVGILGPAFGPDLSSSLELIKGMLAGATPAVPKVWFGVVDVRDVVDLHLRAMTDPAANGERFLAVAGDFMRVQEMALAL